MKNPMTEYKSALADFSKPGERWAEKGRLTYWGKAAGLTADEIIADAHSAGVMNRDADIRRGWNDVTPRGYAHSAGSYPRRRKPAAKPQTSVGSPSYVSSLIGGRNAATMDDIFTLSPSKEWVCKDDAEQTKAFLRTLFPEDAMLHIFRSDKPAIGRLGRNLMPCRDWVAKLDAGTSIEGDVIVPNTFTGAVGTTADGRESFIAQSCLASFPYLVIEFDNMPLATQCAFWCSFIKKSKLAPKLASIVYSGGKSLHGLLRIGAVTLQDWSIARDRISALFASDSDNLFRADIQAMRPRTGTRLPGVQRFGNGELQRLLYLNPAAVGRIPPAIAPDAPETASGASGVAGKAKAASCEETRPAGVLTQSGEADNLPYHCADCFAIEKCRLGYGKFWHQKSGGGVGCYCRRWKESDNCKRP